MSEWTADDRAAARAYLQRCEVRLSTLHRVATALLSGAGLMVLLPALMKDQVTSVMRTLITAEVTLPHLLLTADALIVLGLPFVLLFVLLGDLTRFYFHAQHLTGSQGRSFAPRFTLTGLRMPSDELGPAAAADLAEARRDPATVELLVPANAAARSTIDTKLDAYGGLARSEHPGDDGRVAGLFELVASRERTLAEEVAKVEHGMARHLLRLQVIVMRYTKALLAFLMTALAVFSAVAIVDTDPALGVTSELALAASFALWAPMIVFVVGSPVHWVQALLRTEGSAVSSIAQDREFSTLERITVLAAVVGWAVAVAALVTTVATSDASAADVFWAATTSVVGGVGLAAAVRRSLSVGTAHP